MVPFRVRLQVYQGATWVRVLAWKAGTPAVPVDLSGCTARMQVRPRVDSADVLLELTTDNGRIVLGGDTGQVALQLTADETELLDWRQGVYDLEVEFPGGTVRRLAQGQIVVSPEVTRG